MSRTLITMTLCFLISACTLPSQNQSSLPPQVWFDMPLPNTVFLPGENCRVIAHGASLSGISSFELLLNGANGQLVASADQKATLAKLERGCGNLKSGKNTLSVRARDGNGTWSATSNIIVFLAEPTTPIQNITPTITSTLEPETTETIAILPTLTHTLIPTSTFTLTPTLTPTLSLIGEASIERISTNTVYMGASSCGPTDVTILARATAPTEIRVVVLFYRFVTEGSTAPFESISMDPIGGDLYQKTLNPTILLGGTPFEEATMQYQVVVQQTNGDTSIRTPVWSDIFVEACGSITRSCSSYSDERACIANGCSWVSEPGLVPIYSCKNP